MFEECKTLAELNAARIAAASNGDIVEANNAYNKRRNEIISTKASYTLLTPIEPDVGEMPVMSCVPIIGRSPEVGCIKLTDKGFLY